MHSDSGVGEHSHFVVEYRIVMDKQASVGIHDIKNNNTLTESHEIDKQNVQAEYSSDLPTPVSLQNRYVFKRELGHGGQAKLFQAVRLSDNKPVAVKQLNISSVKNWKEYELFHREADVLSSLRIPGVAAFYEVIDCLDDASPCSYIVQEFIEGESMAKKLKDGHRFKVTDIYDILLQLLYILKQLHRHTPPVIHRDIKPSNVMISPGDGDGYRVTLIDFGAVANPQVQSGGSTVAGTFGYMPPEQLMGRSEPASDIYSLGAMAVELFSGKSPGELPMKDFRLIFEPELEQLPLMLIATLREMLDPKIENRLSDIDELIRRFDSFRKDRFEIARYEKAKGDAEARLKEVIFNHWRRVKSIGDNGNMDIWQLLPEAVPRDFISIKDVAALFYQFNKTRTVSDVVEDHWVRDFLERILMVGLMILVGMTLIGVFGIVYILIGLIISVISDVLMVIFSVFYWMIAWLLASFIIVCVWEKIDEPTKDTKLFETLYHVLIEGRKTVATIKDIQYVTLNQVFATVNRKGGLYIVDERPCFRVSYGFNPPDDLAGESELVHHCIVHEEPEGRYQIGDPLPILYRLESDGYRETISSTPFPFSCEDICFKELVTNEETQI